MVCISVIDNVFEIGIKFFTRVFIYCFFYCLDYGEKKQVLYLQGDLKLQRRLFSVKVYREELKKFLEFYIFKKLFLNYRKVNMMLVLYLIFKML